MINEDLTLAYMWVEPHLISSRVLFLSEEILSEHSGTQDKHKFNIFG